MQGQLLCRRSVPLLNQTRGQNLYKPGDGLKTISDVLSPKPEDNSPATWKTHTVLGTKRETNLFHYTDRKAGSGYSNFRVQPYPHRPFVFPVAKKPSRNIIIALIATICFGAMDHDWIDYKFNEFMNRRLGITLPEPKTEFVLDLGPAKS